MLKNCLKKSLHNKFTNTLKASEYMICKKEISSDSPNFVKRQNNRSGQEEVINAMSQLQQEFLSCAIWSSHQRRGKRENLYGKWK